MFAKGKLRPFLSPSLNATEPVSPFVFSVELELDSLVEFPLDEAEELSEVGTYSRVFPTPAGGIVALIPGICDISSSRKDLGSADFTS